MLAEKIKKNFRSILEDARTPVLHLGAVLAPEISSLVLGHRIGVVEALG